MATPTVESVTETVFASAATAHACNYPATVDSGDLLLIFFANDDSTSQTDPTGYTQLDDQTQGNQVRTGIYAKVAAGTEGGTTIDVPTGAAQEAAAQIYRISGWGGTIATDIDISTVNAGTSDSPDASIVTAGWGVDDNLFITVAGAGDDNESASAAPGGWTNLVTTVSGGIDNNGPSVHSARLADAADTKNPGNFLLTGAENWVAWTLAIKPSSGTGIVQKAMYHYRNHGKI